MPALIGHEHRDRSATPSRARRRYSVLLLGALIVSGCAGLLGPRTVVVSDAELSRRLAARFPIERRWLEIFDLQLNNPRVSSDAKTGRLRVEVDLRLGQRLTGRSLEARLLLFAKPRYEASDHSIRITDVSIDAVRIDGDAESMLGRGAAWPLRLIAQALDDSTIHQLNADQLTKIERQGMVLRKIEVGTFGLQLNFEPASASPPPGQNRLPEYQRSSAASHSTSASSTAVPAGASGWLIKAATA